MTLSNALRLALAVFATAISLHASDWLDQVWPEAKIYIKTGPTNRIYLQYASTRTREEGYSDGQIGAHMDFYFAPLAKGRRLRHPDASRNKMVMVRTGYYYAKTPADSPDPFTEHTALIEATPRFFLPRQILVENRFRCDFRFVDGVYTPRFRDRLRIERTFPLPHTSVNPYSEFEAFYDWRYHSFHRQRYSAGAEWLLHKRFVLEGLLPSPARLPILKEMARRPWLCPPVLPALRTHSQAERNRDYSVRPRLTVYDERGVASRRRFGDHTQRRLPIGLHGS
jgi:hypothetical protein